VCGAQAILASATTLLPLSYIRLNVPHRLPKLKLLPPAQAPDPVQRIYGETQRVLGVPHVNLVWQAYGVCPEFLELLWGQLRPALALQATFDLAERLRAGAFTRIHGYFAVPDFGGRAGDLHVSSGAERELNATAELFYYEDALALLLVAAIDQAFELSVGRAAADLRPAAHPAQPVFSGPALLEEETASAPVRRIYDEIKSRIGVPVVNTAYRALARWSEFLTQYWGTLRPMIESPLYVESLYGVRDTAMALARELPATLDLTLPRLEQAGIADESIAEMQRVTQLFLHVLSGLLLNITVAKVGLEGGTVNGKRVTAAAEPKMAA